MSKMCSSLLALLLLVVSVCSIEIGDRTFLTANVYTETDPGFYFYIDTNYGSFISLNTETYAGFYTGDETTVEKRMLEGVDVVSGYECWDRGVSYDKNGSFHFTFISFASNAAYGSFHEAYMVYNPLSDELDEVYRTNTTFDLCDVRVDEKRMLSYAFMPEMLTDKVLVVYDMNAKTTNFMHFDEDLHFDKLHMMNDWVVFVGTANDKGKLFVLDNETTQEFNLTFPPSQQTDYIFVDEDRMLLVVMSPQQVNFIEIKENPMRIIEHPYPSGVNAYDSSVRACDGIYCFITVEFKLLVINIDTWEMNSFDIPEILHRVLIPSGQPNVLYLGTSSSIYIIDYSLLNNISVIPAEFLGVVQSFSDDEIYVKSGSLLQVRSRGNISQVVAQTSFLGTTHGIIDSGRRRVLFGKKIGYHLYSWFYDDCTGFNFYGENCTGVCDCTQICDDGVLGDGRCICFENLSGENCTSCEPGYFGPNCDECECSIHGSCLDSVQGNGTCICAPGWSGLTCEEIIPDTTQQADESQSVDTPVDDTETVDSNDNSEMYITTESISALETQSADTLGDDTEIISTEDLNRAPTLLFVALSLLSFIQ